MPTPQDNLRVKKPIIVGYKMSPQQLVGYYISQRKVDRIYDADKAKMYRDKQNMYNSTLFGPSSPTNYDATTEEGQKKIKYIRIILTIRIILIIQRNETNTKISIWQASCCLVR